MDSKPRSPLSHSTPQALIVIPARWASTRFPGKPLHLIAGKPLVQHVWERCQHCKKAAHVVIATDDVRIAEAARAFGAEVVMTEPTHPSGTDRVAEAAMAFPECEVVINVQGDEPLISPALIDALIVQLSFQSEVKMITAAAQIEDKLQIQDPNVVKVVLSDQLDALYFSRSPIPYLREDTGVPYYRHLGIYGFQRSYLFEFVSSDPSLLEKTECLEQLRAVEQGVRIRVVLTEELSPGVDTLEQAVAIEALIQS